MTSPLQVRDDVIGRQLALHVSIVERSLTSALLFVCQQFALAVSTTIYVKLDPKICGFKIYNDKRISPTAYNC